MRFVIMLFKKQSLESQDSFETLTLTLEWLNKKRPLLVCIVHIS